MKTNEELGITQGQRELLIKVVDLLEQEQIGFDMSTSCNVQSKETVRSSGDGTYEPQTPCNTNACIGGWMAILEAAGGELPEMVTPEMGEAALSFLNTNDEQPSPFYELFWGETDPGVTPAMGAQAVRNFLEHGDPRWYDVAKGI